ncbi:capsid protein [Oryzicola mucosus]|uniref:Capsid protein n=1 Tax=Oryzicola mucosus TaxID=2767425 RepID=A0A8J6U4T0_9HYPH|nr:capsid protein [Oryzicola mucosus]MBD0414970.1 capsid protein [Oryzicola mucosus]
MVSYPFVQQHLFAVTPSSRTRHAELLRLCARIGYSPPTSV